MPYTYTQRRRRKIQAERGKVIKATTVARLIDAPDTPSVLAWQLFNAWFSWWTRREQLNPEQLADDVQFYPQRLLRDFGRYLTREYSED